MAHAASLRDARRPVGSQLAGVGSRLPHRGRPARARAVSMSGLLMRRTRMPRCAVLAMILLAPWPAASAPPMIWQNVANRDGVLVERREHEGSRLYEMRATAESPLPPATIFSTIWRQQDYPQFVPYLKRLDVLSDAGDERLVYEQIAVPLARDRDYTVRVERRADPTTQRYEIVFSSANEAGPRPDGSHLRVSAIRGRWLVEPGPEGQGSRVHYQVFSDPGGGIPTWLVNRAQGDGVAKLVRAMLDRAAKMARGDSRAP